MSQQSLKPAVVLVADRTLSANYKVLFEGIFATMQTTQVPELAMRHFVSPRMPVDAQGRARAAALGLRRVESALLGATTLTADDIVCATPETLHRFLGPWTKIVAVSSSDFLGRGMSNTTTSNFWKGRLYTAHWTDQMMKQVRAARDLHHFKVVAGGAGAWQLAADPDEARRLGFDVIFEGYFEGPGPELFNRILQGQSVEPHIRHDETCIEAVRPIAGPSMLGVIELSRGCGKGCRFCTMGRRRMEHLPKEIILADLATNARGGQPNIVSGSEDFFRYGGTGPHVNFEALHGLLEDMRKVPGLSFLQADHGNVSSVLQLEDDQLRELRRLLEWPRHTDYMWVNLGIESANGQLVQANGPGKIAPFRAEDWPDMVRQAADKMIRCGFYPVFSVILGLPGETPQDVAATLELVRQVQSNSAVVFPIFHEPVLADAGQSFTLSRMRQDHLDLYTACYENNFRRVPELFWDNQRAGGVSWAKRTMIQLLGKTEVRAWRKNFARVRKGIAARRAADRSPALDRT